MPPSRRSPLLQILAALAVATAFSTPAPAQSENSSGVRGEDRTGHSFASTWRWTRHGWQDSSKWERRDFGYRPIERVSPILVAVNLVLASLFVLIWCSDEWQVGRLLGHPGCRERPGMDAPITPRFDGPGSASMPPDGS